MRSPNSTVLCEFYCVKCGNKGIPIQRKPWKKREAGHLKKLYCLHCKEEVNHAECHPGSNYTYDDFLFEFNNKNFNENGERVMTYNQLKGVINNE